MFRSLWWPICVIFLHWQVAKSQEYTRNYTEKQLLTRIRHGHNVISENFPFVVRIYRKEKGSKKPSGFCTGSVLSPICVLTANHCFRKTRNLNVLFVAEMKHHFTVSHFRRPLQILRPKSQKDIWVNDVAIMILDKPRANSKIKPVQLDNSTYESGERVEIFGYGRSAKNEPRTQSLRIGQVQLMSPEMCIKLMGNYTDIFCANRIQNSMTSDLGDSGGPVIRGGKQIGVISRHVKHATAFAYIGSKIVSEFIDTNFDKYCKTKQ